MGGGRCVWGWERGGTWEGETGGDDGAGASGQRGDDRMPVRFRLGVRRVGFDAWVRSMRTRLRSRHLPKKMGDLCRSTPKSRSRHVARNAKMPSDVRISRSLTSK